MTQPPPDPQDQPEKDAAALTAEPSDDLVTTEHSITTRGPS